MNSLFVFLAFISGTIAIAFLVVGTIEFSEKPLPEGWRGYVALFLDLITLSPLGTIIFGYQSNWRLQRESRKVIYTGLIALAVTILFGYLAIHTA